MRALPLLLALSVALAGCGDSAPQQRPETARKCGELEGVEPVEPVIIGQYPVPFGPDEVVDCPIIEPVPCTSPASEYVALCGSHCVPQVAAGSDGDSWLVGCSVPPPFCGGLDYSEDRCAVDPGAGRTYWIHVTECSPAFLPMAACWSPCAGERTEDPAEWCPLH